MWMRLDRRPSSNVGPSALVLASGVTPSNDSVRVFTKNHQRPDCTQSNLTKQARLASSLDNLLTPKASHENHILFIEPCLLATLRLTLLDLTVVMDEYKLTSVRRRGFEFECNPKPSG